MLASPQASKGAEEVEKVESLLTFRNDQGEIVGSFTDKDGYVHGFIFFAGRFFQFDAPGSSQTPAFGVMGTLINGVNDRGDIVGFFSDGMNVNGFVNFAPASE